jgi:hypothetical protein
MCNCKYRIFVDGTIFIEYQSEVKLSKGDKITLYNRVLVVESVKGVGVEARDITEDFSAKNFGEEE